MLLEQGRTAPFGARAFEGSPRLHALLNLAFHDAFTDVQAQVGDGGILREGEGVQRVDPCLAWITERLPHHAVRDGPGDADAHIRCDRRRGLVVPTLFADQQKRAAPNICKGDGFGCIAARRQCRSNQP